VADSPPVDAVERRHGGGECDPLNLAGQARKALDGSDQVNTTLAADRGMDLVQDDRRDTAQQRATAARGEQDVEGFRGGDEDLGRPARHSSPLLRRGVAGPGLDPDLGHALPGSRHRRPQLLEGLDQVAPDVAAQRLQGRYVENPHAAARPGPAEESVDRGQEGGQRLARTGGGREQDMFAGRDGRPGQPLGLGGLAEARGEPAPDHRMEELETAMRRGHGRRRRYARDRRPVKRSRPSGLGDSRLVARESRNRAATPRGARAYFFPSRLFISISTRRANSSGGTSSTRVAIHQVIPKGSRTPPSRLP
jgi:hypothetical protein